MTLRQTLRGLPMRHRWLRWAVLGTSLCFSAGVAYLFDAQVKEQTRSKFEAVAIDKGNDVESRLRAYSDVLYSLRGLLDASAQVTGDDFRQFADALSLGERYPGLTNISWSFRVPHAEKERFQRARRAEAMALSPGSPPFTIKPPGDRDEYVVLSYIEPMGKNIAAWGLDLNADPLRRSIVERARDSGRPTSGSGVTLVRDSGSSITSTLMRLAVYRGGGVPPTVEERRRLFSGVVGSTVRVDELVESALSRKTLSRMKVCVFSVRDPMGEEQLLYDSLSRGAAPALGAEFRAYTVRQRMAVGDREWRLEITPLVDPVDAFDRLLVGAVMLVGLAVSLLLFGLVGSLAAGERRGLELAQRNREITHLTSLGEDLHACLTLKEACEVLDRQMPGLVPGTSAALYLFDAAHARARIATRWGSPTALMDDFSAQDCQSVRRGHPHHVEDSARALNCGHFSAQPPRSYLCTPLSAQGELVGVLHVQRAAGAGLPSSCSEAETNLIRGAAQHLALAVANLGLRERLLQRATRDNLTGLYNRHYMAEWLQQELHRAARHGRAIAAVMLDLDHFKRVNDTFGHDAGDLVLREVAAILQRLARKSDVACRQGGEEFLLLMPEASREAALAKAEEVRIEIARLALAHQGRSLGSITVSAGVAAYPADGASAEALLQAADTALYAAKDGGRNRVIAAHSLTAPQKSAAISI
jgi:diguanylate cyclase (GGDEF)-like protein